MDPFQYEIIRAGLAVLAVALIIALMPPPGGSA